MPGNVKLSSLACVLFDEKTGKWTTDKKAEGARKRWDGDCNSWAPWKADLKKLFERHTAQSKRGWAERMSKDPDLADLGIPPELVYVCGQNNPLPKLRNQIQQWDRKDWQ